MPNSEKSVVPNQVKETLRVKILADGITAKEQNPYQHPEALDPAWDSKRKQWSEKETSLRTFEIDNVESLFIDGQFVKNNRGGFTEISGGEIYSAELLPNGKIKILD